MTKPIPEYPLDIFTPEAVINAREVDDALRELAPVVRSARALFTDCESPAPI